MLFDENDENRNDFRKMQRFYQKKTRRLHQKNRIGKIKN